MCKYKKAAIYMCSYTFINVSFKITTKQVQNCNEIKLK